MADLVRAPWTDAQVDALNRWQRCGWVHPFTCGNDRSSDPHWRYAVKRNEDMGQLVATADGWRCPVCDFTQDWCHRFMLDGPPPNPLAILGQEPKR